MVEKRKSKVDLGKHWVKLTPKASVMVKAGKSDLDNSRSL